VTRIRRGIAETERRRAAELYWQAFEGKLGKVLGPAPAAQRFLASVLRLNNCLSAYDADGVLVGLAGLHGASGGFVGGTFKDMARVYGTLGALWRAPLIDLLERTHEAHVLLMDGIVVARDQRGRGVGTALLDAVVAEARAQGYQAVDLDVIDSNLGARALYIRQGFEDVRRQNAGPLRWLFGFRAVDRLRRAV